MFVFFGQCTCPQSGKAGDRKLEEDRPVAQPCIPFDDGIGRTWCTTRNDRERNAVNPQHDYPFD